MAKKDIKIVGARTNNLKNISCTIPGGKLTVITGVSGSGKSSLALDTLFAEGKRRYIESLSTYARQFLERIERPEVDFISNIPPAIALEQKNTVKTARSTVGTATELHDYLRLLFATAGVTICPQCRREVKKDNPQSATEELLHLPQGSKLIILAPVSFSSRRGLMSTRKELLRAGFYRLYMDGEVRDLSQILPERLKPEEPLLILIDRLILRREERARLTEALETAFRMGKGKVLVLTGKGEEIRFDAEFNCSSCGRAFKVAEPNLFSFNSPLGACPTCHGFGKTINIDMDKVIPNPDLSIEQEAIAPWNTPAYEGMYWELEHVAHRYGIPLDVPFRELTPEQKEMIIDGVNGYPGIKGFFDWLQTKRYKVHVRVFLSRFRGYALCPDCGGSRLKPEGLNVYIGEKNIHEFCLMSIGQLRDFFQHLTLTGQQTAKSERLLLEVRSRLRYLDEVGLGYLTLDRQTRTLSGGEAQRISLASALGSSLTDTLYVLDEPTVGLHSRDTTRLLRVLKTLRTRGNTVVVIEHDPGVIREADKIIDMGPGAGENGGEIVFSGSFRRLLRSRPSLTGAYLREGRFIPHRGKRREPQGFLVIRGARQHNLKNIDLRIPLGTFTCLTGVSGSGKSTLVNDILYAGFKRSQGEGSIEVGEYNSLEGLEQISDIKLVDQSPLARSIRSNPATYIKTWDEIRRFMANTPRARLNGITPAHFSFNVPGGRCEVCQGVGFITVEMHFLADVNMVCEECEGKKFKPSVLEVTWRGKNIWDILNMTVSEAMEFFRQEPRIVQRLQVLSEIGLGYLKLGQNTATLSGGEAQRLKLATLPNISGKKESYLFLFDEPTTGLHMADVEVLLRVFDKLLAEGHSILAIEHNLDFISQADYIIDLGPEGGEEGGEIVAEGRVEDIMAVEGSYTGAFLRDRLEHLKRSSS